MSGQRERSLGQPEEAGREGGTMTSASDGAATLGECGHAAQSDPSPCDATGTAASALPHRIGGILLPAAPAVTIQPQVGLELLRRVLDGLKEL